MGVSSSRANHVFLKSVFSVAFDDWIQTIKITNLKLYVDAMALLAWWSTGRRLKLNSATKFQQQNEQLHFIQMLQDLLFQSNSKMLKCKIICHGFIHSWGTLGQIYKNYFTFGFNRHIMLFKKRKTYFGWTFISSDLPNFCFKDFRISAVLHFVSQWAGWEETKLWHFSLSWLFLVLKLL